VTRAAAYRAGERIRDERTSEVYDYSDRCDVAHKEIVLPADLADDPGMAWARDRATLWNAAEHAGLRCNSRLAREWLAILPTELTSERRIQLARSFAKELADKYGCAVDVCVHLPRPGADARNHHVHLLMTHREVTPDGMGRRTNLELGGRERHQMGLEGSARDEYVAIRERWAQLTNEALRSAGLSVRVDHRSYLGRGINREPTPTLPEKVFYAEQRSGKESAAGNAIRARHRERVEVRKIGNDELGRVVQRQKAKLREGRLADLKLQKEGAKKVRWGALTREERNEKRRDQYRTRRALEKQDSAGEEKRREQRLKQYHARMQQDPEAVREARRRWRAKHSEEINRNQREYRRAHAEELALKRREYRRSRTELEKGRQAEGRKNHTDQLTTKPGELAANPVKQERFQQPELGQQGTGRAEHKTLAQTAEESARRWMEYRQRHGPGPTAAESASRWMEYRQHHGPGPTAAESARNWQALRERQKDAEISKSPASQASGKSQERTSNDDDDTDRKPKKQRSHDQDFEI